MDLFCPSRIVIWGFEDKRDFPQSRMFYYMNKSLHANFSLSYSGMAVLVASAVIQTVIKMNGFKRSRPMI